MTKVGWKSTTLWIYTLWMTSRVQKYFGKLKKFGLAVEWVEFLSVRFYDFPTMLEWTNLPDWFALVRLQTFLFKIQHSYEFNHSLMSHARRVVWSVCEVSEAHDNWHVAGIFFYGCSRQSVKFWWLSRPLLEGQCCRISSIRTYLIGNLFDSVHFWSVDQFKIIAPDIAVKGELWQFLN